MIEKQYKELLKTLGIGANKSNTEAKELLEAKLNEYLDRTDAEAEQMVSDIQDALDYVEELIEKMGGGIALVTANTSNKDDADEVDQKALGQATKKNKKEAVTYTSSADASGQNANAGPSATQGVNPKGKPWFYSLYGDTRVDDMFEMAEGDLQMGDFSHALSVFETILRSEMTNPGAYMGKVLANYKLREPKNIATCYTKGLESNADLKRAENGGNEKQKKFIRDALEERRKAMIYVEADKILQKRNNPSDLLQASSQFDSLGSYRDASKKADECKKASKQVQEAEQRRKEEEKRRKEEEEKRREDAQKRHLKNERKDIVEQILKRTFGLINTVVIALTFDFWRVLRLYISSMIENGFWFSIDYMVYMAVPIVETIVLCIRIKNSSDFEFSKGKKSKYYVVIALLNILYGLLASIPLEFAFNELSNLFYDLLDI